MRYELKINPLEPIFHARTAADLMLTDLNVDDVVSPRAHAALRAAYQAVPANGDNFELRNLMASIATASLATLNQSNETRASVTSRCISIAQEARRLCE